jgi:hypothetical protein
MSAASGVIGTQKETGFSLGCFISARGPEASGLGYFGPEPATNPAERPVLGALVFGVVPGEPQETLRFVRRVDLLVRACVKGDVRVLGPSVRSAVGETG